MVGVQAVRFGPRGRKTQADGNGPPKNGKGAEQCSLMFAYVRFIGKKIVEAPILISDASALGSPLKKRAVAALGERRPVYFRGKAALPTAATVSSEFFRRRSARRGAGWRRAAATSRTTDLSIPLRSDNHLTITTRTMSSSRRRPDVKAKAGQTRSAAPPRVFKKLLVANRSEIAIRVFRAATELGLRTVGIYAQEDRLSVHRFKADEAYPVGKGKGPVGAYLDIEGIVTLAQEKGVDLIHPGYGFLAENAEFARAVQAAGITFVGPRPELIELMGDKVDARALARKVNIPTLPGTEEPIEARAQALKVAQEIGFPLLIKAAFGGGGRGLRLAHKASELNHLLDEAREEAARAFGNPAVFLEQYIPRAKHIEVQVLGDRHGQVLHLHERDCSVQRRHQKVVEIAPSVGFDEKVRQELCAAAVRMAREVHYDNAGTVEFLYDLDRNAWFFIEMNPRIQVEHTVTEVITSVDLVRSQILVAQGWPLFGPELDLPPQDKVSRVGYAVQCRITTEDPENKFTPDYGKILTYRSAAGQIGR